MEGTDLGEALRRRRTEAGLTQEELAEQAGISARAVSDIERDLRRTIYRDTAVRLAAALKLDPTESAAFESLARGPRGRVRAGVGGEPEVTGAVPAIPNQLTRLIGREQELGYVLEAFGGDARLVTLTGSGGIGKTRLALEIGSRAQGHFRDGVFFVPLAAVRDPGLVAPTLARALGASQGRHTPSEAPGLASATGACC